MKGEMVQLCTSVMHSGQIFVITCPTLLHNSIKNTLTSAALRKQRGKSLGRQRRGIVVCGATQTPASMATLALSLLWTNLEREYLKSIWSALSSPSQQQEAFPSTLS